MPRQKKQKLLGGGMKADLLKEFIDLSYRGNTSIAPEGYEIDTPLSDSRVKVYTKPNSKEVIVTHRGSVGLQDWWDNAKFLVAGKVKNTKSYKMHRERHLKAVEKYGADNIIGIGHSRAGLYLQELQKEVPIKEIITYNKAVGFYDALRENPAEQTDVKVKNDFVSLLSGLQKRPKPMVEIESTKNPLDFNKAHQPAEIEKLGDQFIGLEDKTQGGSFFQTPLPIVAAQYVSNKSGLFGSGTAPKTKSEAELKKSLTKLEKQRDAIKKGKVYKTTNLDKVNYEISYIEARLLHYATKGEDLIITKKKSYGDELPRNAKVHKAKAKEVKPEPKKEEPKPEPKKRGRPKKEVLSEAEKPKQEPKVKPKKEVKQLLLEFKEIKEEPKIEVKEEPKIEVNQKNLKAIFDEIGATASKCKEVMCKYNIKSKDDFKKWIAKNHPDKGGTIDDIEFKAVIACAMKKKYCTKKMVGGIFGWSNEEKEAKKAKREAWREEKKAKLDAEKKARDERIGEAVEKISNIIKKNKAKQEVVTSPKAEAETSPKAEEPVQQGITETEAEPMTGGAYEPYYLDEIRDPINPIYNARHNESIPHYVEPETDFLDSDDLIGGSAMDMLGMNCYDGKCFNPVWEKQKIKRQILSEYKIWSWPWGPVPEGHIRMPWLNAMIEERYKPLYDEFVAKRNVNIGLPADATKDQFGKQMFSNLTDALSYVPGSNVASAALTVASALSDTKS